jgi:4-hydroxy-tetrahydrodipicolinate reductase
MLRVGVHGACGKMGQRVVALVYEAPDLTLAAAMEAPEHPRQGQDIGLVCGLGPVGVLVSDTFPETPLDVVIDFSVPQASVQLARRCTERGTALVVATTGFNDAQRAALRAASERIPLLVSPNMSFAVNLLMVLVQHAAAALKEADVDIEIIEKHHRYKKDAPSGTALEFGRLIAEVVGPKRFIHGREGLVGERPRGEIGFHAVRVGDNVGEHTIIFGLLGETLEFTHRALTRDCYARGALQAARLLVGRPPGLYHLRDLLPVNVLQP